MDILIQKILNQSLVKALQEESVVAKGTWLWKELVFTLVSKQTEVQTLIFSKPKFDRAGAIKWAKDHDFRSDKVDETSTSFRLRQKNPGEFQEGSFRTIELADGVKAVIGKPKGE